MTEDDARRVLLLRAFESPPGDAGWHDEDRAWATRQAIAAVGDGAAPERFVATRATLALTRLLPRAPEAAQWLERRWWHPLWVLLALLLGALAGLAADQLGPPQRVNLLAPAVWAVVLWNLFVYATALLPQPKLGLLARGLASRLGRMASRPRLQADWLHAAAPLLARRAALLMHSAAAGLALGLIGGLYLRGLVMDYRAGWQSTFLDAASVQAGLSFALAPASWLAGVAVPAVAPLQLAPGAAATASAAPWIHLYAATLMWAVVLPRSALAVWAALRAAWLVRQLPLPLADDYFEGLHPLMRPGTSRPLTLLWCPLAPPTVPAHLLGHDVALADDGEQRLFDAGDGERVHLRAVPGVLARPPVPLPWWRRLFAPDAAAGALRTLQREVDAVLLVLPPGATAPRPAWLAQLSRPLIVLEDTDTAVAPVLPLRALADGWLADGVLWQALAGALPDDRRRQRLAAAWCQRQSRRLDDTAALLAASLARIALAREALPEPRFFGRAAADEASATESARSKLLQQLDDEFATLAAQLAPDWGAGDPGAARAGAAVQPRVQARVGEGRAALWGGVVSGALTGLKADLATGGLTLGAGAVAGGVIGALGAAGVARGINTARGSSQGHVAWGPQELDAIAAALLGLPLRMAARGGEAARAARLQPALAAESERLAAAWQDRGPQLPERLAPALQRALKAALGGPA
jgi:hypothetical protein